METPKVPDVPPVKEEEKVEVAKAEKVEEKKDEAPFGVLPVALEPDQTPLNSNGYVGVDPNKQGDPLEESE